MQVDASWKPEWVGTEQGRFFRFDGDRLQITTMWLQAVIKPERRMMRGSLTFERAK
jgi:hypothetical protein